MTDYKHWRIEKDDDNIVWAYIDRAGSDVNTLHRALIEELSHIVDELKEVNDVAGLVIGSAKKTGFVAGADIKQFTELKDQDEAVGLIRHAQQVFDNLEALPFPTVAMIDGFCLGGGMELSLACRYRVATDNPKTKLGLPEVKLGIHPGWGGTVRLPRLVGVLTAFGLILTGRTLAAKAAKRCGMIDAAVAERYLVKAARQHILDQPTPHQPKRWQRWLHSPLLRPLVARLMYKKLAAQAKKEHYPAPYAVVHNWLRYGTESDKAMVVEAESIGHLLLTDTARNLVRVFFMQTRLKGFGKGIDFKPLHVHVVGAGIMGGDIAAWCAFSGLNVTLQDQTSEAIAPAMKRAHKLFKKKLKVPRLIQAAMDRLNPDPSGDGIAKADVIIEAIFEDLGAKQRLFKQLEARAKPGALLATNTSSIPLQSIAEALQNPARLVGIHFFNPVAQMPLVEVVKADNTDETVVNHAQAFVCQINRFPLPVKSHPGFLVNRVLMPYLLEAMKLLEEGVPPTTIDKAATDFGMPMGPITLADTVGLDICLSVAKNLMPDDPTALPQRLLDLVEAGDLGKKTGSGFYSYNAKGKPEKATYGSSPLKKEAIIERLILRMLKEAFACLREGVVADEELLDAGMIFGTGFAPFRGGLMHYADTFSGNLLEEKYQQLAEQYGDRFEWNGTT